MGCFVRRICGLLLAAGTSIASPASAEDLTVFAAASLQNALTEVGNEYRRDGGRAVRFSFAASSALARQIEQGAPAAVFISADEQWMDYLQSRKLILEATRRSLLSNRLVLVVPASSQVVIELKPGFDLSQLLGDGRWVTGDPAHVPVGRYAQEALGWLGVWAYAQTRLVRAENVRAALAFVERGEAAAGIVYATDAAASTKVRIAGVFPPASHTPISYPVAVVAHHDSPAAREFLRFIEGPAAAAIFQRYGFSVR